MSEGSLLRVEDLAVHFPVTQGVFGRQTASVKAVDGISFEIKRGGTLGLVGESGCGKSTAGRAILRLLDPTAGRVHFDGRDITKLPQKELRDLRREIQIIFQDPFASLNPRMTVMDIVGESLAVHGIASGAALESRVLDLLARVGIPRNWVNRYPHEFSGGQRQRISIARAIALEPKLVICDEAVSALDVSIQAQVINLLIELRREMDLAYLFISHDLSVVRHISDEIAVMYLGQIVERAPTDRLFGSPVHPYTRALLSAIPVPDPTKRSQRILLRGDVPSPLNPPSGCHFHTRCPVVMDRCRSERPPVFRLGSGHEVKCFLAEGIESDADYDRMIARTISARVDAPPREAPASSPLRPRPSASASLAADSQAAESASAGAAGLGAAIGGLLLLAGWTLAGSALSALALWAFASRGRRSVAVSAGVALALCLMLGRSLSANDLNEEAARQLAELSRAVEAVASESGTVPASLRDLGWRLAPIVGDSRPIDPWGRSWQYRMLEAGGFALGSFGADGVAGGDDDVGDLARATADPG